MTDARFTKRQVATALRVRQIEEQSKGWRELAAALPFYKIILFEMWEQQQREIQHDRALIMSTGVKCHHQLS